MLSIIYLLLCVRQCICIRLHSSSCVMMILTERSFATAVVSVENPLTLVGSDEQSDARLRHYGWCLFLLSSLSGSLKLAGRRRTSSDIQNVGHFFNCVLCDGQTISFKRIKYLIDLYINTQNSLESASGLLPSASAVRTTTTHAHSPPPITIKATVLDDRLRRRRPMHRTPRSSTSININIGLGFSSVLCK